jgi:hypothetical protein
MTLRLNGSSDGSVSLQAPADTSPSGTDVTLTLPTSDGDANQVLQTNGSGALSWVAKGTINQVLQNVRTGEISVNTTTYTNLQLSQAITPSSTSSKILVMVNVKAFASGSGDGFGFQIRRDIGGTVTNIYSAQQSGSGGPGDYQVSNEQLDTKATLIFLDEPSTTSEVTYSIFGARDGSSSVFFHPNTATTGRSQLILLEVGA